jgi:hypothetical protein
MVLVPIASHALYAASFRSWKRSSLRSRLVSNTNALPDVGSAEVNGDASARGGSVEPAQAVRTDERS